MSKAVLDRWTALLDHIRQHLPEPTFETWFCAAQMLQADDTGFRIGVPNAFTKRWIERNYAKILDEAVKAVCENGTCEIVVVAESASAVGSDEKKRKPQTVGAKQPLTPTVCRSSYGVPLHSDFTLDTFIPGASNQIARAAALHTLTAPGTYNPLVVSGASGSGKSHLLQAIARAIPQTPGHPGAIYINAETFVNGFTKAVTERRLPAFRSAMRNCAALIVDDIHVFAQGQKTASQEEFIHTFDALLHAGRQIILATDRAPELLTGLLEKLRDRLQSGLTVSLNHPDRTHRMDLLREKAARRHIILDPETLEWLADTVQGSAREVEGAVNRITALSEFGGLRPTLEVVQSAFSARRARPLPTISLEDVAKATAKEFGLSLADLTGRKRTRTIRLARQLAMVLARQITTVSLSDIGTFFGKRSHATVLSCLKKAPDSLSSLPNLSHCAETILLNLGFAANTAELFAAQGNLFSK